MRYKPIENSIYTDSRSYDPLTQPDMIRVRIADGAILADNRDKYYGATRVAMESVGNREFWAMKRARLTNG